MTIEQALNSELLDILDAEVIEKLLIDQGLIMTDTYTKSIGTSKAFQLAYAYGLCKVVVNPNWSQGDISQSWNNKDEVLKIASSIFINNGVRDITGKSSSISSKSMW